MSAVPIQPRVKHRTAATRRVPRARASDTEAAAPDPEPNMRLSRALLVMLLLHVVAVGGILAFSLIKEHGRSHSANGPTGSAVEAEDSDVAPAKVEDRGDNRAPADTGATLANSRPTHSDETVTRVANDSTANNPANDAAQRVAGGSNAAGATTAPSQSTDKNIRLPADSGKTYVVKKGDTPITIADHLKVDATTLLKLNGIDDPKKLKPGQTLKLPAPTRAKGK